MKFSDLGLNSLICNALEKKGYTKPTPIQAQAIPIVLKGNDVMASAQTGTGKTAGFTLPIIQRLLDQPKAQANRIKTLILTPTRELAAQIQEQIQIYAANTHIRSAVIFGGVSINPQMMKLRKGVEILIATPGRLLDLYSQNAVKFDSLNTFVLDEADRMLDMGFINDLKKIHNLLPKKLQTLMFSATFSSEIKNLANEFLNNPQFVSADVVNTTVKKITQKIYTLDKSNKINALISLIKDQNLHQVLVFSRTKNGANKISEKLNNAGISSSAIHGNKSQTARTKALADFKSNDINVLVATDIAARGIDIAQLPCVINLDLSNVAEDYVHRIGRTGRAGQEGLAISLVSADEVESLSNIEHLIGHLLPREELEGFEATHNVPITSMSHKNKAKKIDEVKIIAAKRAKKNNNNKKPSNKNDFAKKIRQKIHQNKSVRKPKAKD
ncbi:DEAD/DEAH box helicase [Francisella tularensis]|uniref:DEAD-box ATP-dependent RNA helicase RhpA n=2 Tax=Francisella tularensis subsp. holarctica TaxID=119857 RepID=A0AAI8BHR2_FRATH|nr:DEAD/DEAH box helicase [Francisella tularensis]ABI83086.1 ATP-dependent RNA helicase [Francisella tularensis subsp. holarctica OSU18]AFT92984.1 ATP-dependent RNA helicase [Francisella tularensis subsp. holarctica FSC200]AJI50699.1 DEAD/DEAH box helicase family protein [Francisella tularensis subsp. holarctica]AJI59138.1 DEAD/DEAH box helicase family protein [Francisella tularensis subsp. holarctica LVS]AJI65348.1 DEAD/DEAH box helicase family protein [Francisella tularensis subsp. holarctic